MKQCKCGSFAFNLAQEGVDQRGLCDRHYWQDRAEKADVLIEMCERALKTSKVWHSIALHKMNVYPDCIKSLAAIAAHRGQYSELSCQCSQLLRKYSELEKDAARINWLETAFDKSWNGVIDSGGATYWRIAGDHRNRFKNMNGATFRDAIDAAIAKDAP